MSSPADSDSAPERPSRAPKVLGLLALGVLALAFAGALLGSLRNHRWDDSEDKGEVARRELARLEVVLARARVLLAERGELRARLPMAPESSLRVTQLNNLIERHSAQPAPPFPDRSRVPTSTQLEALDHWLDSLYRRVAAGQDVESRLPDLEAELRSLEAMARKQP